MKTPVVSPTKTVKLQKEGEVTITSTNPTTKLRFPHGSSVSINECNVDDSTWTVRIDAPTVVGYVEDPIDCNCVEAKNIMGDESYVYLHGERRVQVVIPESTKYTPE